MDQGFPKSEHLYGEIRIENLFKTGERFLVHPIKVVYAFVPREDEPVRAMFSVPKRNFKHAVDRNRIKRLMRESYRLQKSDLRMLMAEKNKSVHVAFTYIHNELPEYEYVNKKMTRIIGKLTESINSKFLRK